ncbi:hypothetical protein HMN09_01341800 [Mycena chlorophos]|uniref:Uncharacterized protein n=1 Tax=Mycena chlorophos TaxID=658473 RepID=A0A8H6RZD5_MYCCL|nr:hypothetical protein HMN09_01341800 [Mycena chlorophos]
MANGRLSAQTPEDILAGQQEAGASLGLLMPLHHSSLDEYGTGNTVASRRLSSASKAPSHLPFAGRRLVSAIAFAAVGCAVGFGIAWNGGARSASATAQCVAHFEAPRPLFDVEAAPVVITLTTTVHAAQPTWSLEEDTQHDERRPVLQGPPTAAFRDNLLPDVKYVTTWPGSGWTNDVLLYINLLYLALITERVAIIPPFTPTHVGGGLAPTISFHEIFDVPRLEDALNTRIITWHDVKDPASEVVDELGCWSVWKGVQTFNHEPHFTSATTRLKLDVSYTTAPSWIKLEPNNDGDPHASFWALASLTFPQTRAENLREPTLSPINQVALQPDESLVCFDYLYYIGASGTYEWEADYSPAWRFVGKYLHFTDTIVKLAEQYVRDAVAIAPYEPTPPYIAIHVRHGDFAGWCEVPLKDCFAPLSAIARRVEELQDELWEKKRLVVDRVVVTSDERDPGWWDEVNELGWVSPDHSQTAERYGAWYPLLIDAAIQAGAIGFVGTDRSTVSTIARKRVEAWNDGLVRTVKWGYAGADEH